MTRPVGGQRLLDLDREVASCSGGLRDVGDAVAATIAAGSQRHCTARMTLPAGEVVVEAPIGVALERWMPVFM
jgi:hypothetical protein